MNTFRPTWLAAASLLAIASAPAPLWGGQLVRVGVFQNSPKIALSAEGRPEGIFVDLLEAIAKKEEWTLQYVPGTWSQCLDRLETSEIDLLPDVAYTHQREARYAYHREPVLSDWFQIYAPKGSPIRSLPDLNGKRVSLLERSVQQESFGTAILGFELDMTLVPFSEYHDAFVAAARGEVDAVIANRFYGTAHSREHGLEDTAIIFNPTRLFIASGKAGDRALLDAIDRHLVAFKKDPTSVYYRTLNRWAPDAAGFKAPAWLKGTAIAILALLVFFLLWSAALRGQVAARTRDLAVRNTQLQTLCLQKDQAEAASHESELRYRTLFETASVAIQLASKHRLIECNAYTLQLFGCSREELFNTTAADFSPPVQPDGRPSAEKAMELIGRAQTQGPQTFEWEFCRRDGTRFTGEVSLSSLKLNGETLTQSIIRDITKRKRTEQALRESDERFAAFMDNLPAAAFIKNGQGKPLFINAYLQNLLGMPHWEGQTTQELIAGELGQQMVEDDKRALENGPLTFVENLTDSAGTVRTFETTKFPIRSEGKPVMLGGIAMDMTEHRRLDAEREKLQAQLIQAQKMESIGRLAGGVAHDFNNMLCVILGNVELCTLEMEPNHPLYNDLMEIKKAAERSANLTRQLLAFARRQTVIPRVLDLNATVGGMLKMLQRLIGEDIELSWQTDVDLWPVKLDPSQIDQILANLCVNARDAISSAGKLLIETRNTHIDEAFCADHPDAVPGDYVVLAVSDNGCGMDKATREHLFEPFFTTKGVGKGTGLGLATVYGIVKQNSGFVCVYTEPGKGTTVQICLPRYASNGKPAVAAPREPDAPGESDAPATAS